MAQCVFCNGFYPPSFTERTEDGKASKCVFCVREIKTVEAVNPATNELERYTKENVINEYKRYLKQVMESPNVKQLIVDDAVNQMKKEG